MVFWGLSFKSHQTVQELERPDSGGSDQIQELQLEIDGERYPFSVVLEAVPWEEEALLEYLTEASSGLEALFLRDNPDLKHIRTKVSMPSAYPGTPIAVQWYLDSWDYIKPDGTVNNEGLTEPVPLGVQAVLSLAGQSLTWEQQICICPLEEPDLEQKLRMVSWQIQRLQQSPQKRLALPDTVAGESIRWYQAADRRYLWIVMLTFLSLLATIMGKRQEEEKERKKREKGMRLDYPDIVSRLSLYMSAGISTRKSWERMIDKESVKGRAAYEEMRTTLYEMQSGVPEAQAYERFGMRCCMPAYLKLGTLLSQNLRKGTKDRKSTRLNSSHM